MSSERASTLGAHLEELDRLLHDVQAELVPDRDPRPVLAGDERPVLAGDDVAAAIPEPPPPEPALDQQIRALTELSERLLASMRELLNGYERVIAPSSRRPPEPAGVTLSAGPFPDIEALREFEAALSHLRGVREVTVRGYEGTDRAIIDVRLA